MAQNKYAALFEKLIELYPNPETELDYRNHFELLVAVILSAQCTDKRVNMVTPALFEAFPNAQAMAGASVEEIRELIKSINFFPTKARNLLGMAQQLMMLYRGKVPKERASLEALPGVGRKTANVVMANAFGIPTFAVDTHVHRVANRLGWVKTKTPEQTEQQLLAKVPEEWWIRGHHLLILHGRRICIARAPKCEICPLLSDCPYGKKRENMLSESRSSL